VKNNLPIHLILCLLFCFAFSTASKAQVTLSDDFEDGTLTNTNSTTNPQWTLSSATTFVATNATNLSGSFSLRSATNTTARYMSRTFTTGSMDAVNYTWRVLYRNNSTTTPTSGLPTAASARTWRLWLAATAANLSAGTTYGYALVHQGTTLALMRYNSGGNTTVCSYTIANNTTYTIRVTRRASDGFWQLYVDTGTGSATTSRGSGNNTEQAITSNVYTGFECNDNNNAGTFIWDNYSVTAAMLTVTNNTNSVVTNAYAGNTYPFFSFQLTATEDISLKDIYIASSYSNLNDGKISGNAISLIRSTDNDYYTTGDNTDVTASFSQYIVETTQMKFYNNSGYTIADGTSYYYFVVGTLNNPYTGSGTPPPTTFSISTTQSFPDGTGSFIPVANNIYNVNAYNASSATPVVFGATIDWTGASSTSWTGTTANWSPAQIPTSADAVRIGVVTFTNQPTVSAAAAAASLTLGTTKAATLTVNSTLTVSGAVVQNHSTTATSVTSTIAGTGTLNCASFTVGDSGVPPAPSGDTGFGGGPKTVVTTVNSTIAAMNVTGAINLNTTTSATGFYTVLIVFVQSGVSVNNATFNFSSGVITANNLTTTNSSYSANNVAVFNGDVSTTATTLNLLGANPISVAAGGTIDFTTGGSGTGIVNYAATSGSQAVYTTADDIGVNPENYDNLTLSGAATKVPTSGALTVGGNMITSGGAVSLANDPLITVAGTWTNSAAVTQDAGNITVTGGLTNTGTFTGAAGTIGTSALANSGTFTGGAGAITVSGFTTLTGGTFTTGGGLFTTTSGLDNTTGTFQQGSGNVTMTGSIRQFSGIMNFSAGTVTVGTSVQVTTGTMNAGTGALNIANALQINGGTFNAGASPGTITVTGPFSNAGTYVGSTGTLDVNGTSFTNTGILTLAGGTTNIATTTFSNTNPGTFIASGGTVNFDRANAQAIDNTNTTTPVAFYNVTFSAGNTKTLGATGTGTFTVAPLGILTMAASTTLAGGTLKMTLLSTASGSAAVDVVPSTAAITGTFNVQRFLTGGLSSANRGYRLMSSPVNQTSATLANTNTFNLNYIKTGAFTGGPGGTGSGFSGTSVGPTLYLYKETIAANNTTTSFTSGKHVGIIRVGATDVQTLHSVDPSATISSVTIPIGNGFLFYFVGNASRTSGSATAGPPQDATITAPGYLNQGTFNVRLWHRADALLSYAAADASARGFCMVGNPYASTINLNTVLTDNATANGISAIYVLNSRKGGTAQNYISYTNLGNSSPLLQGYAVSGGGFIVKAKAATSFLTFKESQKVASTQLTGNGLIMSAPKADELAGGRQHEVMAIPSQSSAPEISGLYMKMEQDPDVYEYTGIYFRTGYEAKYDNNDALYLAPLTNTVGMASLSSDGQKAAVNIMPDYHQGSRVKLHVYAAATGMYQLKLEGVRNIDEFYDIYLLDHFKKDSLDIRRYGVYNFNVIATDTATFGGNRFELVIRRKPVPQYLLTNFSGDKITDGVNVAWKTVNESNYTGFTLEKLNKSSSAYEPVYEKQSDGSAAYSFIDRAPSSGINKYRLKQNDIDGRISYSEPITVFYDKLAGNGLINVFPNPTVEVINVSIPGTMSSPSYKFRVFNSSGNLVMQKTTSNRYWTEGVSQLKTGVYIVEVQKSDGTSL
jgi:hypothetical protein